MWEIDMQMEDSGKRQEFETGAIRDSGDKPRPDLISPYAQMRKGEWLRQGAAKYNERNWEKGMKFGRCVASIFRHLLQYMMGWTNEDHLAAVAVNAEFLMHYEKMIALGKLPASLNDLPQYEKKHDEPEKVGEFTIRKAQDERKGWYIILTKSAGQGYVSKFLHKDLEIYQTTGWDDSYAYGYAPGYYNSKEYAKVHIEAYEKQEKFVCPAGWVIKQVIDCGYWVQSDKDKDTDLCLWKDNQRHKGTGWRYNHQYGEAPGYWSTKEEAEAALAAYLEKEK